MTQSVTDEVGGNSSAVSESSDECVMMSAAGQMTVEEFNEKYMAARKVRITVSE